MVIQEEIVTWLLPANAATRVQAALEARFTNKGQPAAVVPLTPFQGAVTYLFLTPKYIITVPEMVIVPAALHAFVATRFCQARPRTFQQFQNSTHGSKLIWGRPRK
jgi:hypothetical protein